MTHQAQSQKLKPVVRDASGIQLQLETINNQTYIIMEDVNLLKHKLLTQPLPVARRATGAQPLPVARRATGAQPRRGWVRGWVRATGRGWVRATGSGRARFARRGKRIIASICSFLF